MACSNSIAAALLNTFYLLVVHFDVVCLTCATCKQELTGAIFEWNSQRFCSKCKEKPPDEADEV